MNLQYNERMTKTTQGSVAKALIINEKREALILTIGDYKAHPEKSFKPDLPGGLVDPGESERDAVVREIEEETGIISEVDAVRLVYAQTEFFPAEQKSVLKFLYVLKLSATPEVVLSWEHVNYEWIPLDRLEESIELRPFYKEAVRYGLIHGLV